MVDLDLDLFLRFVALQEIPEASVCDCHCQVQ